MMDEGDRKRVAFITGITGQDGSYLAEFLLSKGYVVHGIMRSSSNMHLSTSRVSHLFADPVSHTQGENFNLHYGDLTDASNLVYLISKIRPDEVYNLAAQSHVKVSFEQPEYTNEVNAIGTLRVLEAIRIAKMDKVVKFYQASSSELYGKVLEVPQTETTPFYPRSPYGVAKLAAFWLTKNYREAYNIFASNGILFNHESPRRGVNFVTRKITRGVAKISLGQQEAIELGNLDAKRDWGHAKDYVEAMWLILQHHEPDDFVISTGQQYSVRLFIEKSFKHVGVDIIWKGSGLDEVGLDKATGTVRIRVNEKFFRPAEVDTLLGDSTKARTLLKWQPKCDIDHLVKDMMDADIELMKRDRFA